MKNILYLILIAIFAHGVSAQSATEKNPCDIAETKAFDFLVGDWEESEKASSKMSIKKIFNGCAIQEFWGDDAMLLRAYDAGKKKWYLTFLAKNLVQHQIWEGRWESNQWRFYREWILNGEKILSRTYWNQLDDGFVKIVEQSRDNGITWKPHAKQLFKRRK